MASFASSATTGGARKHAKNIWTLKGAGFFCFVFIVDTQHGRYLKLIFGFEATP